MNKNNLVLNCLYNEFQGEALSHHGILGMKWGVRRFQNKDGSLTKEGQRKYSKERVLKKGSKVYRVALTKEDPTYDNKKYLSTNRKDRNIWKKYFGRYYNNKYGQNTYEIGYKTVKDIKIARETELGKAFLDVLNGDIGKSSSVSDDTNYAIRFLGWKPRDEKESLNTTKMASLNMAAQTKTGKEIVSALLGYGFEGVVDVHGKNTANDPIIVFNPDENLKKISVKEI